MQTHGEHLSASTSGLEVEPARSFDLEKQIFLAGLRVQGTHSVRVKCLQRETMEMNQSRNLGRILEAGVVVSWADLMRGAQTGLVHIEYSFAPSGTLDFLQVWSAVSRGHWLLVCSWMSTSAFQETGVYFENGYESEGLAHILESVMQHQDAFTLPQNLGRPGLLQISTPKDEEGAAAAALVKEICEHFGSVLAQPALA